MENANTNKIETKTSEYSIFFHFIEFSADVTERVYVFVERTAKREKKNETMKNYE